VARRIFMHKADFKRFYAKHFDRVYRFVLFRVQMNRETAEDLTSEIFIKALEHFAKYDPDRSQVAWIMTIARNRVINHWRDKKEHSDIDDLAFCLEGSDGRKDAESRDDIGQVQKALRKLGKKDRKLIELKHLLGYRYKDMEELLDTKAATLRVETHRAMKKLKSVLQKIYDKEKPRTK